MIRSFTIIVALVFQTTLALADFSPDGNQITFNLIVNNSSQIFISNTDGSNTKQISLENGEYFRMESPYLIEDQISALIVELDL